MQSGPMRFETGHRIDLLAFLDSYVESGRPLDRLSAVMAWAVDFKLQVLVLTDVRLGEADYEWIKHKLRERDQRPNWWRFQRYTVWQYEIVAVRIAWERLMQLVHTIETGRPHSYRKGVIRKFTTWVGHFPHWRWLEPYAPIFEEFDNKLRTPELHKHSTLRSYILGDEIPREDINRVLAIVINVWLNVDSVVKSGLPTAFGDLHIGDDDEILPRYLGYPDRG